MPAARTFLGRHSPAPTGAGRALEDVAVASATLPPLPAAQTMSPQPQHSWRQVGHLPKVLSLRGVGSASEGGRPAVPLFPASATATGAAIPEYSRRGPRTKSLWKRLRWWSILVLFAFNVALLWYIVWPKLSALVTAYLAGTNTATFWDGVLTVSDRGNVAIGKTLPTTEVAFEVHYTSRRTTPLGARGGRRSWNSFRRLEG